MKTPLLNRQLVSKVALKVRFSEVDSLGMVWHGNYIKFLEDGREAFGREHGLTYLQVYEQGYVTPIVKTTLEHKSVVRYGDEVEVITRLIDCPAAKIVHRYDINNLSTGELAAVAETIQAFTDTKGTLQWYLPEFYETWKSGANWQDL